MYVIIFTQRQASDNNELVPKYEKKQTFAGDMNVCYHLIQRQASDKNELVQLNPTAILISKK